MRRFAFFKIVLIACLLIGVTAGQAADLQSRVPQVAAPTSPVGERARASARLTHLLYAAVLDQYASEGLKEYRPDFLLHERYRRTFLYEWGLLLENQETTSTQDAWKRLSARPSYLGKYYYAWMRTFPFRFQVHNSERISIGNARETFLESVLKSELEPDFDRRVNTIFDLVSALLLTSPDDQKLGLKIIEAMRMHSDPTIREKANATIQGFPKYAATLSGLVLTRNISLGLVAKPDLLVRGAKYAKAAQIASREIELKFANAIRFREVSALWQKASPIQKALAVSVAVHGAVAAYPKSQARAADTPNEVTSPFAGAEHGTGFLVALSLNTASERATRFIEQRDFAVNTRTADKMTNDITKDAWIAKARTSLASWLQSGKIENLSNLLLEGERLKGLWPIDSSLARTTMQSRYLRLKKRIETRMSDSKGFDLEGFRKEVLSNELEDYRGQRRTMTAMLLDWGGNCEAQTLMLVSLLTDFPELIPDGSKLGVFLSSTHMEAVLLESDRVRFLVSGEVRHRTPALTILKPQSLLLSALTNLGDRQSVRTDDFYLNGKPTAQAQDPGVWSTIKRKASEIWRFDFEVGIGTNSLFAIADDGEPKEINAPKHGKMTYGQFKTVEGIRAIGTTANDVDRSETHKRHTQPITRVPLKFGQREVCLVSLPRGDLRPCNFSSTGTRTDRGLARFSWGTTKLIEPFDEALSFDESSANQDYLYVSQEHYRELMQTPPEFWFLKVNQWHLEHVAKSQSFGEVTRGAIERAKRLEFNLSDIGLLESFDLNFNMNSDTAVYADIWNQILQKISTSDSIYVGSRRIDDWIYASKKLRSSLKERYPHRPELQFMLRHDPLEKFMIRSEVRRELMKKAQQEPAEFVRAFTKLENPVRLALVKLFQSGSTGDDLQFVFRLRDYMDQLNPNQIDIVAQEEESDASCSKVPVNPPVCSSPLGCTAFRVVQPPVLCSGKITERRKAPTSSRGLTLTPVMIAQLTLLSSGGFHLWDQRVFDAVEKNLFAWFAAGVDTSFPFIDNPYPPDLNARPLILNSEPFKRVEAHLDSLREAWFNQNSQYVPGVLPGRSSSTTGPARPAKL